MKPFFALIQAKLAKLTWKQYVFLVVFITSVLLLVFGVIEIDAFFRLLAFGGLACTFDLGPLFCLILFSTLSCYPKKPTIEQQARKQVETKIKNNHEAAIDSVSAMPKSDVDSTLANDSEFQKLWKYFSDLTN